METGKYEFITLKELRERLGLSRTTINRLKREYGFPFLRLSKSAGLYNWPDVQAWMIERMEQQGKDKK